MRIPRNPKRIRLDGETVTPGDVRNEGSTIKTMLLLSFDHVDADTLYCFTSAASRNRWLKAHELFEWYSAPASTLKPLGPTVDRALVRKELKVSAKRFEEIADEKGLEEPTGPKLAGILRHMGTTPLPPPPGPRKPPPPPSTTVAALWADFDFQGARLILGSNRTICDLTFVRFDRMASSIIVNPGFRVRLFTNRFGSGNCSRDLAASLRINPNAGPGLDVTIQGPRILSRFDAINFNDLARCVEA